MARISVASYFRLLRFVRRGEISSFLGENQVAPDVTPSECEDLYFGDNAVETLATAATPNVAHFDSRKQIIGKKAPVNPR